MAMQKLSAGILGADCQREKYHHTRDDNKPSAKQSPCKFNKHAVLHEITYTYAIRKFCIKKQHELQGNLAQFE
jgi:hypothetical protein